MVFRLVILFGLFGCLGPGWPILAQQPRLELLGVQKIWDRAPHNAFTDLIRFNDQWWCVFREGRSHVSPDGALRVIRSRDGEQWESAALMQSPDSDLRDAKITVTPDGRLMLSGAEALNEPGEHRHHSLVWFSEDGERWSPQQKIAKPDQWLWRITWHDGLAYGFAYDTLAKQRGLTFYRSKDGKDWEPWSTDLETGGTYPNETALQFQPDGKAICLLRHDGQPNQGQLGWSEPPYQDWHWQAVDRRIGGPQMIVLPDGSLLAAVRLYDKKVRTSLCWVDAKRGKLAEALTLPSGGDTSYAGMVWHEGQVWVSYYSSHEGKTAIYLARVQVSDDR